MEVPRLGVGLELQVPAYTAAPTPPDLNLLCDLHCGNTGSLTPLSGAGDQTHILMGTSRVLNPLSHGGISQVDF